MGVSENWGGVITLFWSPYNKDPTIWGTILGSPTFGNLHMGEPEAPEEDDELRATNGHNKDTTPRKHAPKGSSARFRYCKDL